ncbi:MAG: hypothetical protein RBU28_08595 [Bacteroidales bacterium]|jgi:hypothetical protein|nr:hypothetical protein [Bacteroidales bacterium]
MSQSIIDEVKNQEGAMKDYFEFNDVIQNPITSWTWLPVRANIVLDEEGDFGHEGYKEEYLGTVGILFNVLEKTKILDLEISWSSANLSSNEAYIRDDDYILSGEFLHGGLVKPGNYLVLQQLIEPIRKTIWHLDQDFILGLKLIRQDDSWISPSEDNKAVARLTRNKKGEPALFEVRREHLLDYLYARKKGLLIVSFRSRMAIVKDKPDLPFSKVNTIKTLEWGKFSSTVVRIHEGGFPYGEQVEVLKYMPHSFNASKDVPELSFNSDDGTEVESITMSSSTPALFRIFCEAWINYWIDPGKSSPRIKGDTVDSEVSFIVDNDGKLESSSKLISSGKWLWFTPSIINEILLRENSTLIWYSEFTGSIGPNEISRVHFGVNEKGLINVFAKDIAALDTWLKRLWAASNVSPEGGVSNELLMAQAMVNPARTIAPEVTLLRNLEILEKEFKAKFGHDLFVSHEKEEVIKKRIHRFRAINADGLYSLAKEIYKFVIERIDIGLLKSLVCTSKNLGSIKLLEALLSQESKDGRKLTSVLVGLNELRQLDVHLPRSDIQGTYELAGIKFKGITDSNIGKDLLASVSNCLLSLSEALV